MSLDGDSYAASFFPSLLLVSRWQRRCNALLLARNLSMLPPSVYMSCHYFHPLCPWPCHYFHPLCVHRWPRLPCSLPCVLTRDRHKLHVPPILAPLSVHTWLPASIFKLTLRQSKRNPDASLRVSSGHPLGTQVAEGVSALSIAERRANVAESELSDARRQETETMLQQVCLWGVRIGNGWGSG